MIAVGQGYAAAIIDGRLTVVGPPVFAQIERERVDGPRWSLALREGRRLRERAAVDHCDQFGRRAPWVVHCGPIRTSERSGIPAGWWNRP